MGNVGGRRAVRTVDKQAFPRDAPCGKREIHGAFWGMWWKVRVSGAEVGIFAGRIHALSTDLSTIHRGYPQPVEKWCGKLAGVVGRIGKAARKPVDCREFSPQSGTGRNAADGVL